MLIQTEVMERTKVKFNSLDRDRRGYLDCSGIKDILKWMETTYTPYAEESTLFRSYIYKFYCDKNDDGKITLQEFTVLYDRTIQKYDLISKAKKEINDLNANGSGYLDASAVTAVLEKWGKRVLSTIKVDLSDTTVKCRWNKSYLSLMN